MTDQWAQRNRQLLEYIKEKSREPTVPTIKQLCRGFVQRGIDDRTVAALEKQISRNGSRIQEIDYDTVDKVRMLFMLFVPIGDRFLQELLKSATVVLDRKNRIHLYEANDGSLTLKRPFSLSDVEKTDLTRLSEGTSQPNDYMDSNSFLENLLKRKLPGDSSLIYPKLEPVDESSEETTSLECVRKQSIPALVNYNSSTNSLRAIEFLKQLESLVGTLNAPQLMEFQKEIEGMIRKPEYQSLIVPTRPVITALESALHYVARNSILTESTEDCISLKDFLLVFRATTFHLANFSEIICDIKNENGFLEKRAPFRKIQFALHYAVGVVLP
uniref:SPK domain-containing protein n=1 Tax=Caenorhabditis tropicalis TaxID=1561998 RepID=A0A1I7T0B1_9PELO